MEYYIVGKVTANNSALSGVTVSTSGLDAVTTDANGQFTLTVEEQKEYTLEFAKDGYLKASTIVKLSGLSNRSSVAVSVQMTQKAAEEDIPANQNVLVEANSTNHTTEVSNAANADAVANIATVGAYIPKETIIEAGTKDFYDSVCTGSYFYSGSPELFCSGDGCLRRNYWWRHHCYKS